MKRSLSLSVILVLLALVLVACSGDVYNQSYTASGDSGNVNALTRNRGQFLTTDDLNVVINLNEHSESVEVEARFFAPEDRPLGDPLRVTADENVGTVVLGLDYESKPEEGPWERGQYRVEIYVDGEQVDELIFRVG